MTSPLKAWLKGNLPGPVRRWLRSATDAAHSAKTRIARILHPPPIPRNEDGKVYLNLGCGYITHPAFINIDALVAPHIHYVCSIEDLRPIPDKFADLVYASHCLEHISHVHVNRVLAEWRRVLKPGGLLRIGVPDFDQLIAAYNASGRDIEQIQHPLLGSQSYPLNHHLTMFTRRSLTDRLHAVGFKTVYPWQNGSSELASLPDFTRLSMRVGAEDFLLSLNLEAVK